MPRRPRRPKPTPGVFHVSGVPIQFLYPRRVSVTWNRGELSGDRAIISVAQERARALEGHQVGPHEGPYTGTNHLQSPISAGIIIAGLFVPSTVQITGDVPQRPPIPKNAIG